MIIHNEIFDSFPVIVHSPSCNSIWPRITNYFFGFPAKPFVLKDITIITWNNNIDKGILEKSLDHLSIPYIVMGRGIQEWVNTIKIQLTNKALEDIETPYVMGIDSFDAIVTGDINHTPGILEKSGCEMLFNATTGGLLSLPEHNLFFEQTYRNDIYKHLNAGAWLGRTEFCKEFFALTSDIHETFADDYPEESLRYSEQVRVKHAFLKLYPLAGIDTRCSIFQLLNEEYLLPASMGEEQGVKIHNKTKLM